MSALGAGHSAEGDRDAAAALGPAEALGTEARELPGTLRQMWRYRSWDVPQIPAEALQTQYVTDIRGAGAGHGDFILLRT